MLTDQIKSLDQVYSFDNLDSILELIHRMNYLLNKSQILLPHSAVLKMPFQKTS